MKNQGAEQYLGENKTYQQWLLVASRSGVSGDWGGSERETLTVQYTLFNVGRIFSYVYITFLTALLSYILDAIHYLIYTIQWFLVYSVSCATITIDFKTFLLPQKEALCPLAVTAHFLLSHQPLITTTLRSALWIYLFLILHINVIIQYLAFCDSLISLSIIFSMSIIIAA